MCKKRPWEAIAGYIETTNPQAAKADGAFKFQGDSLEPFLHDGDYVLVQSTPYINHGEIGAFWVDGRVRIMRMYRKDDICKLLPLNPDYPEVKSLKDVECIGRVVGRT